MCGIAGFHIKNPKVKIKAQDGIEKFVDALFLGIEDRGKHASGFVAVTRDKAVVLDKAATTASEFIKDREKIPENVQTVLLHTRYKTKGDYAIMGNNHPVSYKSCFTIHNGAINNDDDLFREYNLKRNFEVDSEVIPALIDKFGMGDLAHVQEALSKFRGPLAIATIDPVNHHGKLLLAKGEHSPLVVFENKDFIIWASLFTALKDAWGSVFGTPPRHDKFRYLKSGDILYVDGDSVTEGTFEVASSFIERSRGHQPWRGNQQRPHQRGVLSPTRRSGSTSGRSGVGTLWGTTLTLFLNEEQFKKAVAYYRTNLEDNAGARVWAKRETYESSRFADVEEGIPFSWLNCLCGESVFMLDMRQHLKYGVVCIDCYEVIRQRYTERAQSAAGKLIEADEEFEADNKLVKLNDQDARNLESWARCASIHNRMTLSAVAQKANLSIDAVDFLLFHTDAIAADFGKNTRTFKTDLEALYKEFSLSIWEDFGDLILRGEDPEEAEGGRNELDDQIGGYGVYSSYTVKKPGGISEVWYLCENHRENFRSGDSCPECDRQEGVLNDPTLFSKMQCDECGLSFKKWQLNYHEKENYYLCEECNTYFDLPCEVQREALGPAIQKAIEAHTGGSTLSDLKRCGTCKTFVSSKYPCRLCEARETEEPKRVDIAALTNVDPATLGACVGGGDKKCKRKVVYCIGSMGVYCKRHFEKCSHTKCDKDANTVLKDNTRVCHGHARGQSGAMADKALQKLDMVFTEVK